VEAEAPDRAVGDRGNPVHCPRAGVDGIFRAPYHECMIGLWFLLALFVGIPAAVFASERLRRRRTQAELEDAAVQRARDGAEGPGDHEPLSPALPPLPPAPPGM
jgi:hypothetical protein